MVRELSPLVGLDGIEGSHRAPASSPKVAGALLPRNQPIPFNATATTAAASAISTGASAAVDTESSNRIQGPTETLARAKQVLAAVSTVLDHSEAIGLINNQD